MPGNFIKGLMESSKDSEIYFGMSHFFARRQCFFSDRVSERWSLIGVILKFQGYFRAVGHGFPATFCICREGRDRVFPQYEKQANPLFRVQVQEKVFEKMGQSTQR